MNIMSTHDTTGEGLDFSRETWDQATAFADGCWVIAQKHGLGLNDALQVNNRTFVLRLTEADGDDVLLVFGCADAPAVAATKRLETETGLAVRWILSNGGAHHMFLDLWYQAFPEARVLIPGQRIPFTRNGRALAEKYADRWELMHGPRPAQIAEAFGGQIDVVIFDQLFSYRDETAAEVFDGGVCDHTSPRLDLGGFRYMKRMMQLSKDVSQRMDEVTLFHRATGLVVGGHNFQFAYTPKGYKPPPDLAMRTGGFPMNLIMSMTLMSKGAFKSLFESQPGPIADPSVHVAEWEEVLGWDIQAWTTCHNPPTIIGPQMSGEEIKAAIRKSLARTGEDDPTGMRLKWTRKHGSPSGA
jgi:hypothetical protein